MSPPVPVAPAAVRVKLPFTHKKEDEDVILVTEGKVLMATVALMVQLPPIE